MRSLHVVVLILLSWAGVAAQSGSARPAASAAGSDRAAVDRAIAAVYPSLVRISVVSLHWAGGREQRHEASGSGTIVSTDGYVVTNHHVAGRVDRITCTLPNEEEIPAELVGTDALSDIAVLKLVPPTPRTFPAATFGTSATLERGQPVLALGSPLALSQSVTRGIVSNTDMVMPQQFGDALGALDGENVGTIVKWIGHDAAIYPGNSGGPLVNLAGEIVGVNEISFGLSGAIPADLAKFVYEAIRRDGRVRRAWLGLELQPRMGSMPGPGVLVSWVASKSVGAEAGIRAGDRLVSVNGAAVDARFAEQLPAINQQIFSLPIGRPAALVLSRDGATVKVSVSPVERPDASSLPAELRHWGIVAANISTSEAIELGRTSTAGVRVINLRPGGPAEQAKPSLAREDVIVEIDGAAVGSLDELRARTAAALGDQDRASVLVGFERGLERRLTVVDVGQPTFTEAGLEARKAWVPVSVQVLTPALAARLGLAGRTGVRVTRVVDPAAPLQVGDVILAIDGEPVRASTPADEEVFAAAIRRFRIGATVTLTVSRSGAEMPVAVPLMASPRVAREMPKYEDENFEFRVRDLADSDADDPRLGPLARGVVVESVSPGGWAALARLAVNDVILQVDGRDVADVAALEASMAEIARSRAGTVVFLVRRGVRTLFLEVRPSWR